MDTTELRRLLSEGTKGPWHANTWGDGVADGGRWSEWPTQTTWTVSPRPDETGWCTDSGCHGYGLSEPDARLIAAAINALPHLLAVVDAATVLDHAQQPWAGGGHGPNGPTVDAAWRDLRSALRALEAGR